MKASRLKTEKRVESLNNKSLGVQSFGQENDYPQRLIEIVDASATGSSCMSIYKKFIVGRGFAQADFYKAVIDSKGTTVDALLDGVGEDLARFKGFALHVNYNALYQIVSIQHVPFEWLRLQAPDKDGRFDKIALHPDWGRRNTAIKKFDPKDIVWFHFFNPDPEVIAKEVSEAGGWNGYKGQILYFSGDGDRTYPSPVYDAVVTDMSSEEGLSNITYRNVRFGFLPAGMVIDYDNTNNSQEQEDETKKELTEYQGDTEAGKLMYICIKNGEQKPEFIPFESHNFDKDFEKAESKTPEIIGRAFQQPPILRAQDVGANFGADLMRNAYDFYNSVTETERDTISRVFARVFGFWHDPDINPDRDYEILPKVYRINATLAERLGDASTEKMLEIIFDTTKDQTVKEAVLKTVYGLEDDEVQTLLIPARQ